MDGVLAWADHRVFTGSGERFIYTVDDAGLFSLSPEAHATVRRWRTSRFIDLNKVPAPDLEVLEGLRDLQILTPVSPLVKKCPAPAPQAGTVPLSTLVLEVAQDCNLNCSYCYAEAGTYGASPCLLEPATARRAVRYLLDNAADREQVTLIFFGGEPLLNMRAIKAATREARTYAEKLGKRVNFSVTTNGTLLDPEIVGFLHDNRFSVAVSLDGPRHIHDRNRPDQNGAGTYDDIVARLALLLDHTPVPVAARVTLEPGQWHQVVEVFDHLTGLGLHEVGIAPVSPVSKALLPTIAEEAALLEGFGQLAERFVVHARQGRVMPFSNILDLLGRLHLGQTKPISCGAGYGYMAIDARGRFFPCHRMAGAAEFCAGSLASGVDHERVDASLGDLNAGRTESCSSCWARTLCAGGCHYENHLRENQLGLPRGTSCRFIRAWLDLGMKTYARLRTDGAIEAMGDRLARRAQC